MKKLLLVLLVTPATLFINAQTTENPFIKRGYDVLVATSSKGEYAEFHDQADIVEIGSVLFNTRTNEVVALLSEGETTIDISSATTAMTIDPFCEKYYWISPYAYVANNPLKYIDPDGRKIVVVVGGKEYTYNGNGVVNSAGKTMNISTNTTLGRVVNAYNGLLNSGDKVLAGKVRDLIKSENTHYIKGEQGSKNKVEAGKDFGTNRTTLSEDSKKANAKIGMGTTSQFNLSDKHKATLKEKTGIEHSDMSIIAHELQHQHDYDQGNMADSHDYKGSPQNDPGEKRAVENENRARKIEGLEERKKY